MKPSKYNEQTYPDAKYSKQVIKQVEDPLLLIEQVKLYYCTEEEASAITGYSASWLRRTKTHDTLGTPIVRYLMNRPLYLRESLKKIRKKPAKKR